MFSAQCSPTTPRWRIIILNSGYKGEKKSYNTTSCSCNLIGDRRTGDSGSVGVGVLSQCMAHGPGFSKVINVYLSRIYLSTLIKKILKEITI